MTTEDEVFDGSFQDIASPTQTSAPTSDRLWVAQGRYRSAFQLSSYQRQFGEDTVFPLGGQTPQELVVSVEFGRVHHRLYTVTKDESTNSWKLYCEDATNQSAPMALGSPYTFGSEASDGLLNIKLWEDTTTGNDFVVVLGILRVSVIRFSAATTQFQYLGSANDMFNNTPPTLTDTLTGTQHIDPYHVFGFADLAIQEESPGRLIAYVLAKVSAYSTNPAIERLSKIVLLCDLDEAHFNSPTCSPTFDRNPNPPDPMDLTDPDHREYLFYNPLSSLPTDGTNDPLTVVSYTANGLDAYTNGTDRYLYVACGSNKQVERVTVTSAFGSYPATAFPLTSTQIRVRPGQDIGTVLADPLTPHTRLFAHPADNFCIWRSSGTPSVFTTLHEPMGTGFPRRISYVQYLSGSFIGSTAWTVGCGAIDHMGKVYDVTSNTSPVPILQQYGLISSCDGGVAIGDNVYLPTFNGVQLYQRVSTPAPHYQAVPGGFQGSEVPADSGTVRVTEHIEHGLLPQQTNSDRLFTCDAIGSFTEYPVDPVSQYPLAANRYLPDVQLVNTAIANTPPPGTPSWTFTYPATFAGAPVYSNDVAYLDLGSGDANKWVLVDLSNFDLVDPNTMLHGTQVMLLAFNWVSPGGWTNRAVACSPYMTNGANKNSATIATTVQNGNNYALIGHGHGFDVYDIQWLVAGGSTPMRWLQTVVPHSGDASARGLAVAGDRVFAWVEGNVKKIDVYQFAANGTVNYVSTMDASSFYDPGLDQSIVPGNAVRGRFYLRGSGPNMNILFACHPYVVQFQWSPLVPNTLTFNGWWHSYYTGDMQDCRMYNLPAFPGVTSILASKNTEAFAILQAK